MSFVTTFNYTIYDFFGNPTGTRPAKIVVDDYGNIVVFCKEYTLENINYFEQICSRYTVEDLKDYGLNVKHDKIYEQCAVMRDIVNNLDEATMIKIVECLPHLDNGTIRSTAVPVYMTGIREFNGYTATSIELSVRPMSVVNKDPQHPYDFYKKIKGYYVFDFDKYRTYDRTDIPVINPDLKTYNKLIFKKNSYLKMEDLTPGYIYKDGKGKEYLYLGSCAHGDYIDVIDEEVIKPGFRSIARVNTDKKPDLSEEYPYVFLTLTDKRKEELKKVKTFAEWLEPYMAKDMEKGEYKLSVRDFQNTNLKIAKTFKVTEEVEKLFDKKDLLCDIDVTVDKGMTPKDVTAIGVYFAYNKARSRFAVIDKVPIWKYTVTLAYPNKSNKKEKTLLTTYDKQEANKYVKDYVAANPNTILYKDYDWGDTTHNVIYVQDDLIAIDPNKPRR